MTVIIVEKDYTRGIFKIKLNSPGKYNTLSMDEFIYICELLNKANDETELYVTAIQSSGKFFSSGGNVADILSISPGQETDLNKLPGAQMNKLCGIVSSPNVYIPQTFRKHKNPIVCCLNGPAIGLSACLVMLCDIVYAPREQLDEIYIQFPFTKLGFNLEVASSFSLYKKLGINLTNELVLFSKTIPGSLLLKRKVIYKLVSCTDIDEFNSKTIDDVSNQLKFNYEAHDTTNGKEFSDTNSKAALSASNFSEMKKQLNSRFYKGIENAQITEISETLPFWATGEPQSRFKKLWESKMKIPINDKNRKKLNLTAKF